MQDDAGRAAGNELDINAPEAPQSFDEAAAQVTESLGGLWADFLGHLPLLVIGAVVVVVAWGAATAMTSVVSRLAKRSRLRRSLRDLLRQIVYCAVWVAGIVIAATIVFPGMTPAKVLTVLGLSSIAVGFAFKDIVENFIAGILVLWRFPFEPGDYIHCAGVEGKVEETTIRMTMIRQVDGQLVVVPNATIFKNPVNVLTSQNKRRVTVICGVAYDEDVDQSRDVIAEAVGGCETVLTDEPVQIFAQEFADSSINFEVTWWTLPTPLDVRRSRDEVVAAVKRALDEAGIEIPFPYRTLTFKAPLSVSQQPQSKSDDRSAGGE